MPKVVDHAARRRELAAALWRIVRRDGIDHISVRAVAAEAGTSPGALRHYFASQDELAAFSLQAVVDGIHARLVRALPELSPADGAVEILEQYVPLDEQRREEMAVYLAFLGRPNASGPLCEIRGVAESRSREGVRIAVAMLASAGRLHPDRDVETETDALYPFVDGLAIHGTLWPDRYPPEHLRRVLLGRIAQLAAPPDPPEPSAEVAGSGP